MRIVPYIDRDDLVRATIHKVGQTILEGITLVFLILILFLGSPRSAFVVAVSIPLALVSVFSLLNLTHVSANLLSLGAIDFGILVDGAIVVTESVLRRREAMPDEELSESEAKAATLQVTRPIFFASLIIITAYLPLFSFERAEAKLFTPMAYTMGYALFGALLTALALVPGLAYLAFRKPGRVYHNRWLERLTVCYDRLLAACLEQPRIIYGVAIFALLAVVGLGATVGREFLPDLDEGALWLQVQMPTGLALDKASDMASDLRRAIFKYPEVSYVVTQTGRNDDGTDPWTMSHIEAPVGLKPYDTWPAGESKKQFVDRLAAGLAKDLPGYSIGISQPIIDGVNDMIGGAHSPLVIKIYGDDLDELRGIGRQIVDVLYSIQGTSSASLFQEPPIPQIEIKLDHEKAARYGVNMTDVQNVIQTGVGQAPVSTVYVGERTYPLTVRFTAGCPQFARGARQPLREYRERGASAAVAVRRHPGALGREHGHARERPAQSHHPDRQSRSRFDLLSRGSTAEDCGSGPIRPKQDQARMGRPVREPAPRRSAAARHPGAGHGHDADFSHRRPQILPPGGADSGRGAAGDPGRPDLAAPHRSESQCRERRRLHRTVRRGGAERHHHGVEPQSHAKIRLGTARGDHAGCDRALAAGADDRHRRHLGYAAGSHPHRRRQRRAARHRNRRGRRTRDLDRC